MNTVVALPIAAALPVAAPSIASGLPTQADAELVRAAQDLAAIDHAFEDLRRERGYDANFLPLGVRRNENIATLITVPATSGLGFQAKASALRLDMMVADQDQHQQIAVSLADDLVGEVRSAMPADRPLPDAELLSLAAKYVATETEHSRLYKLANELEDAFLDEGMPEALRIRPGDAELGIHAFFGRLGEHHNYFNIDVLRWPTWPHPDSKVEIERGRIVAERLFEPSAEARARADEIIAANDQRQKTKGKKKPRRLVAIDRKRAQLVKLLNELDERISEMPATTMEGMVAKARCAKVYDEDCRPDCDDPLSMFGASIVRDLLARAAPIGQETRPAATVGA
jgi:hypothetical protein